VKVPVMSSRNVGSSEGTRSTVNESPLPPEKRAKEKVSQ
jgi:hypothetical protein